MFNFGFLEQSIGFCFLQAKKKIGFCFLVAFIAEWIFWCPHLTFLMPSNEASMDGGESFIRLWLHMIIILSYSIQVLTMFMLNYGSLEQCNIPQIWDNGSLSMTLDFRIFQSRLKLADLWFREGCQRFCSEFLWISDLFPSSLHGSGLSRIK